jgi:hypothetical protein
MAYAATLAQISALLASFAKPFFITICITTAALRVFSNVRVIGVTGSIASGKSAFCRFICSHSVDLRLVDADEVARRVTAAGLQRQNFSRVLPVVVLIALASFPLSGTAAFRDVVARRWGAEQVAGSSLVSSNGQLDRKALGALVFDHPPSRRALNRSAARYCPALADLHRAAESHTRGLAPK